VHERLDQAELLPVSGRQLVHRSIDGGVEALDQRVADPRIDAAPERGEVVEHDPPGQLWVQRQVAGQKAHAPADRQRVADGVKPKDARRSRGGPDEVEQQAQRSRLSRPVRTQKAKHLSLKDLEVEPEQPSPGPEVLG
jgi:hypothetical protein